MINHFAKTFIHSSLLAQNCFKFSQKDLVHLHKAILATKIIRKIKQSSENLETKRQISSLKCQVIKEIEDYPDRNPIYLDKPQENPDKIAKQCMLRYFIPSKSNNNEIDKFGNMNKDGNYEEFNCTDQYDDFISLFTEKYESKFCPTSTVTGMVFKNIIDSPDYCLLIGQRLTGKTYSLILYRLLSEIIFQYKHKNYQNHPLSLVSQIDFSIPKAIYWNEKFSLIEKFIKKQCYELQEFKEDKELFQSLQNRSLQKIYSQRLNIKLVLLIDQFDDFAQVQRFKAYLEKYPITQNQLAKDRSSKQTSQSQIFFNKSKINSITYISPQSLKQKISLNDKGQKIIEKLINGNHFGKVMLWSAENIERKIFEAINLPKKLGQSELRWIKMPYFELILTQTSTNDIIEMIVHQIELMSSKFKNDPEHCAKLYHYLRSFCLESLKKKRRVLYLSRDIEMKLEYRNLSGFWNKFWKYFSTEINHDQLIQLLDQMIQCMNNELESRTFQRIKRFQKHIYNTTKQQSSRKHILRLKMNLWFMKVMKQIQENLNQNIVINLTEKFPLTEEEQFYFMEFSQKSRQILFFQKQTQQIHFIMHPEYHRRDYYPRNFLFHVNKIRQDYPKLLQNFYENPQQMNIFMRELLKYMLTLRWTSFSFHSTVKKTFGRNDLFLEWFQEISDKYCYFIALPSGTLYEHKQFYFLKGFSEFNKQIGKLFKKNNLQSKFYFMFLPLSPEFHQQYIQIHQNMFKKQSFYPKYSGDLTDQRTSMSFLFVKPAFSGRKQISIQAFGVASTLRETIKRIDQFLEEFLNFEDMFETKINFEGQMINVFLDYIVFAPKQTTIDWENLLRKKKEDQITEIKMMKDQNASDQKIRFLQKKYQKLQKLEFTNVENFCQVRVKGESEEERNKVLLRRIGVVSIFSNLQFHGYGKQFDETKKIQNCKAIISQFGKNKEKIWQQKKDQD